jgi:hypothetical protein
MRVDARIAMTGEVFDGRDDLFLDVAVDEGDRGRADDIRRLAEGPGTDNRIPWVVVDVDRRREVDVDADLVKLPGGDAAHLLDIFWGKVPDRHASRSRHHVDRQAADDASLLIGGNQERRHIQRFRLCLELIGEGADLLAAGQVVGKEEHTRGADATECIACLVGKDRAAKAEHDALAGQAGEGICAHSVLSMGLECPGSRARRRRATSAGSGNVIVVSRMRRGMGRLSGSAVPSSR